MGLNYYYFALYDGIDARIFRYDESTQTLRRFKPDCFKNKEMRVLSDNGLFCENKYYKIVQVSPTTLIEV